MMKNLFSVLHNECVVYILNSLSIIPSKSDVQKNVELKVKEFCDSLNIRYEPTSLPDFPQDINKLDLYLWVDNCYHSEKLKQMVKETLAVIEKQLNIVDSFTLLDGLYAKAQKYLDKSDFILYSEHIYVAKRSMEFWNSKVSDVYVWMLNTPAVKTVKAPINWWKVLGCDCIGGLVGNAIGYLGTSAICVIMQL